MANVTSFAQAHAAITGGKGAQAPSISASNNTSNSFQSARNIVVQKNQQSAVTAAPAKPTLNVKQAFASGGLTNNTPAFKPQQQPQTSFTDLAGSVYKGVVGKVGSILAPHAIVTPNPPPVKTVNLPMGLKLKLTDSNQDTQSAKLKPTAQILQSQKNNIDTTNKIQAKVVKAFPATEQQTNDLINDPLNIKNVHQITATAKTLVPNALNTIIDAWNQGATIGQAVGKDLKNKAPISKTAGDVLHGISATANFALSPLTAIFDAANKLPGLGTVTKLITLPFTLAGEGGSAAAGKIVDNLPISQQAKNNLKPAVQEIGALAGQLILGKIETIGEGKKAALTDKYGEKDAKTIIAQATIIAKDKMVKPGTYTPQELRNEVFSKKLQDTPHGKEILKSTVDAEQAGKSISIQPPSVHALDKNIDEYRRFGGYTEGTPNENAALRDITSLSGQPDVKAHTQERVQKAIEEGTMTTDKDGMVTLYRGGKPSDYNSLSSASYDKDVAQRFADNSGGEMHEFKVKPEDIKAFIGRSEGEVLVDKKAVKSATGGFSSVGEVLDQKNTRTKTENKPTIQEVPKETITYDTKGNLIPKNKKVLTGNEVKAVRDVIDAHMKHIRETSTSGEDFSKKLDSAYDDILEKSQGDKVVLSALRTELNKEMYGMAGGEGNYKDSYKALQEMKNDPELGGVISNMEGKIIDLDKKLLSTPDSTYQKPAFVTQREKKQSQFSGAQEPVGTGRTKESRAYKRLLDQMAEEDPATFERVKDDPKLTYQALNQKYDFENAMKIVEHDPQKAYNIAKQFEPAPQGQRWESVNIVLADRALQDKNYALWKDLEQSRSLSQTRAGQGIVAERGRFNDNSPHVFVQRLLDARMRRLGGETELTKAIDMTKKFLGKTTDSAKERAIAKIDQVVEKARQFTKKERAKIDFAQKLLDDLTCK